MKRLALTFSCLLVTAGAALSAQNVANTSQKGSLLIWPLINVENGTDTLIEISNDSSDRVRVKCYYMNEYKGRIDFGFYLSAKQTVSWTAKAPVAGDQVQPPAFPDEQEPNFAPGNFFAPLSVDRGELVCFAVNKSVTQQVAFNHLTGTATVTYLAGETTPATAFRYNAWSFVARGPGGLGAANGTPQGVAGILDLTGGGPGTYDACPSYNIANFMPNGAILGGLTTHSNFLSVVSCRQNLGQEFVPNLTKLKFTVWNSKEYSYTGAYICVDSVNTVRLGAESKNLVNGLNFEESTIRTPNARFKVSGVRSTQCSGTTSDTGLLGVLASDVSVRDPSVSVPEGEDPTVASTTHGSGVSATAGFVQWDPDGPEEQRSRR